MNDCPNELCDYMHDADGVCCNDSCRKSTCKEEFEWCDKCNGVGWLPTPPKDKGKFKKRNKVG